jgi:hypothetical protein
MLHHNPIVAGAIHNIMKREAEDGVALRAPPAKRLAIPSRLNQTGLSDISPYSHRSAKTTSYFPQQQQNQQQPQPPHQGGSGPEVFRVSPQAPYIHSQPPVSRQIPTYQAFDQLFSLRSFSSHIDLAIQEADRMVRGPHLSMEEQMVYSAMRANLGHLQRDLARMEGMFLNLKSCGRVLG